MVVPITLGGANPVIGTSQYVSGTSNLADLACYSTTACVAVGSVSASSIQGVVVPILDGSPGAAQDIAEANYMTAVGCFSGSSCLAVGFTTDGGGAVAVPVDSGIAGADTIEGLDLLPASMACQSSGCEMVGSDVRYESAETDSISPAGVPGTLQELTGAPSDLIGVSCPGTTCVAGGDGILTSFTPGSTDWATLSAGTSADALVGLACTVTLYCQVVGYTAGTGILVTGSAAVTSPTATVTGQVSYTQNGTTTLVAGAPVQACTTDGATCFAGPLTDGNGDYSITVPAGATYAVTAFPPAEETYGATVSTPVDVAVAGQTYSGVDVILNPPPALIPGVSVYMSGQSPQSAQTVEPTVNWRSALEFNLAASVFQTPPGETSVLQTVVLTGLNTETLQPQSVTVYAGGETTVDGVNMAIGLPVDPTNGVAVSLPPVEPIHGPVTMAITYYSAPTPAMGVSAGPTPVIFSNGDPVQSAVVAASDYGVTHTIGSATVSGPDASTFKVGSSNCAGTAVAQNDAGTSPNQSCAVSVTWAPPATPSKKSYQALLTVPVTSSTGQTGSVSVGLYACDSRIPNNTQCSSGPIPPDLTALGGGEGIGGMYVDPSGTVVTPLEGGGTAPVAGATVTLLQEDPSSDTYAAVPQGSAVMSPSNRNNPDTTDSEGSFGWDTTAGTYEITASKSGCTNSPQTTDPVTVPPPATGLAITLDCPSAQTPSLTSLSASPGAPTTGSTLTLSATVTGSSPTGTVSFSDGSSLLGQTPVDSSGIASLFVGSLSPGAHTITATYGGDANNAGSGTQTSVDVGTVAPVGTTTIPVATPSTSTAGSAVTYSATVTSASGESSPAGSVTFQIGSTTLCSAPTTSTGPGSAGRASCSASDAPVGTDTVVATYTGYAGFTGSQASTVETVRGPTSGGGGGYKLVASDGGVFAYGDATFYGSTGDTALNRPIVGMAATPDGRGYWLVASDGGVFAYGDATFYGSTGDTALNRPIVGMAATPDGRGYWLVASDGGVFAYGDATFYGSTGGTALNRPIVGMAATPDGRGYWLVASDGGVFAYGDATFYGSTGGTALNRPIVGMAATPDGRGYWLVASDGGVFAYGDATFYGSTGGTALNRPIVGMAATPDGRGYWLVASDGGVFAYGDATFYGSTGGTALNRPIVGMAGS